MAKLLKLRRGTTSQHGSFTGAEGEVTVDTDKDTLVVHDGSTQGGHPVAAEDMANVSSTNIVTRISNSALAGVKVQPNFGSQNVETTGTLNSGDLTITGGQPSLKFIDDGANPDYNLYNNNGTLRLYDITNAADRLVVNTDGHVDVTGNLDVGAGVDVTGDIISTGKIRVDGDGGTKFISVGDNDDLKIYHDASGPSIIADSINQGLKISAKNLNFTEYTGSTTRFRINDDGHVDVIGNLDVGAGVDVTGNITVSGTVDGRDVASDGSKLDGIESGATADQTNAQIAAALSDQRPSMKGATFTDDGTGSPVVNIKTDDASPWGLRLGNDSYSTNNGHGFMGYQAGDGNVYFNLYGNSTFENWYFQQGNGSTTQTAMQFDTNRAVHLNYQNATRLSTTSAGLTIVGSIALTGTVDGRDVAADGSKLDGIATGANVGIPASGGTFTGDIGVSGGAGALTVNANSDIRFTNGNWTGDACKLQHHANYLYIQGGTDGIILRHSDGSNRWIVDSSGHFRPIANNAYDLGTSSDRIRNIYTNDLHLSNEGHSNEVDGTWGNWTIQEGESDLFLKNNRSGKKYKFNLTEVS